MLTDIHEGKESIPVSVTAIGDNIVIAADPEAWIYVHEVIGDLDAADTLLIKAGARSLASFALDAGQGLTENDINGDPGVPRFKCRPGEAFILNIAGGATFNGSVVYSKRY